MPICLYIVCGSFHAYTMDELVGSCNQDYMTRHAWNIYDLVYCREMFMIPDSGQRIL